MPSDAEAILSLLKKLAASSVPTLPFPFVASEDCQSGIRDRWLEHNEAAEFLGISKSTLYRYVSQRRIESRKIAGRLEYRQSELEKLKQCHIRSARLSHPSSGIILSTLNSGK
jgi:excisionase family DNA binding protein